jgi:glutamate-5-semialdehyde dehydrogenase
MPMTQQMNVLGANARKAAAQISQAASAQKVAALRACARAIREHARAILAANKTDMDESTHLDAAQRDRLLLNDTRVEAIALGIERIAALADPVGHVLAEWDNAENGLHFQKVAVPLGVIGMIYESRPNVTADAAALAIQSGNAIILRGGSESMHSSRVILAAIQQGLASEGLPVHAVQLVQTTDRDAVAWMLTAHEYIDVLIPRGGKSLTERVRADARVPTLLHLDGNCHVYVHAACEAEVAERVIMNAKLRRTGVCGACESLLFDRAAPGGITKKILSSLLDAGCEVRGDAEIAAMDTRVTTATETDWATEYLAPIISAKMVSGLGDAIVHINRYGSHHTDCIITTDKIVAQQFCQQVDSAIVLVNASTQFADGGEFGFGGEIGIATGRLHARGPVGAPELTTYKYIITTVTDGGAVRAG